MSLLTSLMHKRQQSYGRQKDSQDRRLQIVAGSTARWARSSTARWAVAAISGTSTCTARILDQIQESVADAFKFIVIQYSVEKIFKIGPCEARTCLKSIIMIIVAVSLIVCRSSGDSWKNQLKKAFTHNILSSLPYPWSKVHPRHCL